MNARDDTVDPVKAPRGTSDAASAVVFLEILFHADLRLVGARAMLCARTTLDAPPVVVGREGPRFVHDDGSSAGALADPCISRRQFAIRWGAAEGTLRIERDPGSRRELRLFDPNGSEIDGSLEAVRPGTLIAIGDRVLLRVAVSPIPEPSLGLVGASQAMRELRRSIAALAHGNEPILVTGETGTGKELVARALHDASRGPAPFVAINCGAIPDALVESELFGFVRGAFTGANETREGLLRSAGSGTIFLDEIGELPLSAQAKLLRVLQERRVRPVGSREELELAARVVMATHRDLEAEIEKGHFREDLYARIEAPCVALPAVRERREDIPRLFVHFLAANLAEAPLPEVTSFRPANAHEPVITLQSFLHMIRYDWPRNVREIQKLAARIATDLRVRGAVDEGAFPKRVPSVELHGDAPASRREAPTADELLALLDEHDFVQSRLAKALNVSRTTLDKWMRAAGVRRPSEVTREELVEALRRSAGDVAAAARELRVSARGLRLRATELEVEVRA